jgi:hypothetical protein
MAETARGRLEILKDLKLKIRRLMVLNHFV